MESVLDPIESLALKRQIKSRTILFMSFLQAIELHIGEVHYWHAFTEN